MPKAIQMINRAQVIIGKLNMSNKQNIMPSVGIKGTSGQRKGRGRDASVRLKIITPVQTNIKAARVPMFVSSAAWPISIKSADPATATPVSIVGMNGVR